MPTQPSADDLIALRQRLRVERDERIRQRIVGMRAANGWMSFRQIADRVGVSLAYVEDALGEKAAPDYIV